MNINIALAIWRSENFIYINAYICKVYNKYAYLTRSHITWEGISYSIPDIIYTIKAHMKPMVSIRLNNGISKDTVFYRGDNNILCSTESYIKESFMTVSLTDTTAKTYQCVYSIQIDDNVNAIKIHGNEYLIDTYCKWFYSGNSGRVDAPRVSNQRIAIKLSVYDGLGSTLPVYSNLVEQLTKTMCECGVSDTGRVPIDTRYTSDIVIRITPSNLHLFMCNLNTNKQTVYNIEHFMNDLDNLIYVSYCYSDVDVMWKKYCSKK